MSRIPQRTRTWQPHAHVVQEDTPDDEDIDTPPVVKQKDTPDNEDTATRPVVQEDTPDDTTPTDIPGKRMRLADNLSEYFRPTSRKRPRKAPVKYI